MDVDNSAMPRDTQALKDAILSLKKERDAAIMAHYYTDGDLQDIADCVGDSLALAQQARLLRASTIVMCGVHFMGETVKILCPEKKVLVPDMDAGCSLADSCPADVFSAFVNEHPGAIVVSYVNTSAAVKALTDIVVTSGNARKVIDSLPADAEIIFGPDRNLGNYINAVSGRHMLLWDGACHVHEQFSTRKILDLKRQHPNAKLLVHPECRRPLQLLADQVGSTAALLKYARESPATEFIVATESGILHQMRKSCPDKMFIPAPPEETGCACNNCSFMKLNTLQKLYSCLRDGTPEIVVDPDIAAKAVKPIERMLQLSK